MEIELQRLPLLKILRDVGMAANRTSVLPILEDFIFIIKDTSMTVAAYDLETYVEARVPFQSGKHVEDISLCLPVKHMIDFLSVAPAEDLTMEINPKNRAVSFFFKDGKMNFSSEDPNNFPVRPPLPEEELVVFGMQGAQFLPMVKEVLDYVSNDDLRPAMTGVWFGKYKDAIHLVATDAHRLIFKKIIEPGTMTPQSWQKYSDMIVPKKAMSIVSKIFPKKDSFTISQTKTHCMFKGEDYTIISRLIDCKYPDWPVVVPELKEHFILHKKDILAIVNFFAKMSNRATHQMNLRINKEKLKVFIPEDVDFGFLGEAEIYMGVYKNTIDEEFEFALNATFVKQIISAKNDSLIKISHACSPTKAFIINDESLIMPLMMNR